MMEHQSPYGLCLPEIFGTIGGTLQSPGHNPDQPLTLGNEAAIFASAAAGVRRLPQTMRLHLRPLGVCQYESPHPKLTTKPQLESRISTGPLYTAEFATRRAAYPLS